MQTSFQNIQSTGTGRRSRCLKCKCDWHVRIHALYTPIIVEKETDKIIQSNQTKYLKCESSSWETLKHSTPYKMTKFVVLFSSLVLQLCLANAYGQSFDDVEDHGKLFLCLFFFLLLLLPFFYYISNLQRS